MARYQTFTLAQAKELGPPSSVLQQTSPPTQADLTMAMGSINTARSVNKAFNLASDPNYVKNIGYTESSVGVATLFSQDVFKRISEAITRLLQGLDDKGRPIIVPYETISSVLYNVYLSRNPIVGDIYSRYTIVNETNRDDVRTAIDRTIEIIVSQIRNEYEMKKNNESLTIWTTVYGDFNEHGLRQYPPIKIRNKHPDYMQFNMNY